MLYSHIHIQIYAEHNQQEWPTSMNEQTHFFIKIYLTRFILQRVMFLVCERRVGDGDRLLFWPKVLLATIAALLPHLWPGVAQLWVTDGPKALSLQVNSLAGTLHKFSGPWLPGMTSFTLQSYFLSGVYYDNCDCHILCTPA